ncbi:MAG: aminopeptidase [Peptoniphilaceae bacterium]|nr:aminopeptidase [Peptoniphilaceae bacterium]MDD7383927.1 aminopeptidase [Peptoniphilaceae bacterium]MDY3738070.1 aminopeptidase [Peptoniphilaceae bacterium]
MFERKNVWNEINDTEREEMDIISDEYLSFLDNSKTERLAVKEIVKLAKKNGFKNIDEFEKINPKDKVYVVNKNKNVALFVIGDEKIESGMNIVASHIDSPRLDLKPLPVVEMEGLGYLKTHYYGGVKKYQRTNLPLSLIGVIYNKNGEKIDVSIGEEDNEPSLFITELLIHLSKDLNQKKASELIEAEKLNVLVGSIPLKGEKDNSVKANILKILKEKYNIEEDDFQIAEFEIVPSQKAKYAGLDKSMVIAHGQDDRVCSFASLKAILSIKETSRTSLSLFADKEEIGSVGNSGMTSRFFENTVMEIMEKMDGFNYISYKRALQNSKVLSADVTAAYDPNFSDAYEITNSAKTGCGVTISKYTGSGGKGGSNDANAEFLNEVRKAFEKDNVIWQTGELGKTDQGGGGTIAYILAQYNMDVLDCGTAMLSMHAPLEILSRADLYETYRAYKSFFKYI